MTRIHMPGGVIEAAVKSTTLGAVEQRLARTTRPESVRKQLSGVCLTRLPEALFASAVVIVEGETDQAILEGCTIRDDPLNSHGIAVVEAGSKENIPLAHAILCELGIPCFVLFDGDNGAGLRAEAHGKSGSMAEQSAANANRRMQRYLDIAVEDHPFTQVGDRYAVLEDTMEAFLEEYWPEWESTRRSIIATGRGISGKNAATYRLAAIEAPSRPPEVLSQIVNRAMALSPDC